MLDEISSLSEDMYHASVILWAVGFLLDPLIYIFLNKKTRLIAKSTFKNLFSQCQKKFKLYKANENGADTGLTTETDI